MHTAPLVGAGRCRRRERDRKRHDRGQGGDGPRSAMTAGDFDPKSRPDGAFASIPATFRGVTAKIGQGLGTFPC
jgi:hypothetical protein